MSRPSLGEVDAKLQGALEMPAPPVDPAEAEIAFKPLVDKHVAMIHHKLGKLLVGQKHKSNELITYESNVMGHRSPSAVLADGYARHRAMFEFLRDVDLLDAYLDGREASEIETIRTRHFLGDGKDLDLEDQLSYGVSIGYVPMEHQPSRNPIYLTSDFLYGRDMQGYTHRLLGYRHEQRWDEATLVQAKLI